MRIIFAGSPELAVPSLLQIASRYEVCGVLSGADKQSGRGKRLQPTPVSAAAAALGLPVYHPLKFDQEFCDLITALAADLLVVVAYWKIFPARFLSIFPRGGINLHPSLLPLLRGPSPLPATILSGATEGGISVQRLALEMDAGDILLQEAFPLTGRETTASLSQLCGEWGARMISEVLQNMEEGREQPLCQDHSRATFCYLLKKEDGCIDWQQSAVDIDRKIRAFFPWPKAFTYFQGKRLVIHAATLYAEDEQTAKLPVGSVFKLDKQQGLLIKTGTGILAVEKLQIQAKNAVDFKSFVNGHKDILGSRLGV